MSDDPTDPGDVVTISASEMVRLSGVGRERLRTWERRHGFPTPVRCRNNVRRYAAGDVRHVIAVSRAVDRGVPLAEAIEQALSSRTTETGLSSLGPVLDHAPTPAIAISGPEPLTVVWANGQTQAAPDAPEVGSSLLASQPGFGAGAKSALQRLLIGDGAEAAIVTHTDWIGTFPAERRSIAWRVPPQATDDAVVVLLQLPDGAAGAMGLQASSSVEQAGVWTAASREARLALQREHGLGSAQRALSELVRGTGGIDAFLATCSAGGAMRSATSVRGTLPAKSFDLPADSDVRRALDDGEIDWVGDSTLRMLGAPPRAQAIVVPVDSGGERIGAMFLLFPTELPLADVARELLLSLATTIGTVLQREHHMAASDHGRH